MLMFFQSVAAFCTTNHQPYDTTPKWHHATRPTDNAQDNDVDVDARTADANTLEQENFSKLATNLHTDRNNGSDKTSTG